MTATLVNHPEPVDVHDCKDNSLKALLVFAGSLGCAITKTKGAFLVKSPNATTALALPANNGLRAAKFKSAVDQVCRFVDHDQFEPGPHLVDDICRKVHCQNERHRLMRQIVADWWPNTIVAAVKEVEETYGPGVVDVPGVGPRGTGLIEEPPTLVEQVKEMLAEPEELEFIERPALAHMSSGVAYESKAAVEREWPDGRRTIHCNICYEELSSIRAVGGHRRKHVQAGETSALAGPDYPRREDAVGVDPDWVVSEREQQVMEMKATAYEDPGPITDEEWGPFALAVGIVDEADPAIILRAIRALVSPGLTAEIRNLEISNRQLADELREVTEERDQLRSNLDALRDMLTDLTNTQKGGG
jgi:hypothetical protein